MAGGGAGRGTLVHHYVAGHRRPLLDRGSPETKQGPAVANPRIRVCSTVVFSAASGHARSLTGHLASEPIGRRTLMPHALEMGHESGQRQTEDTQRLAGLDAEPTSSGAEARVPTVGVAPLESLLAQMAEP